MCSMSSRAVARSLPRTDTVVTGGRGPLTWRIRQRDRLVVVVLDGELDRDAAPWLGEAASPLAAPGRHLIVDLYGLRSCGPPGLSLFLRWQAYAIATDGSLHLVTVPTGVCRLIMLAGLRDVLRLAAGLEEVIGTLNHQQL